eukprot:772448-Amphidinium_carterae.1
MPFAVSAISPSATKTHVLDTTRAVLLRELPCKVIVAAIALLRSCCSTCNTEPVAALALLRRACCSTLLQAYWCWDYNPGPTLRTNLSGAL